MWRRRAILVGGAACTWAFANELEPRNRAHSPRSEAEDSDAALRLLEADGFCVLQGAVADESIVAACSCSEAGREMPRSAIDQKPAKWKESAFGRYHRIEFSREDVAVFEELERPLLPLVRAFFEAEGQPPGDRGFFRSELQLLTAVPQSAPQMWHSDRARGLTLLVPLVDFTLENGATQLLPGSHRLHQLGTLNHGPTVACAPKGSVVAYDARVYHRGLGNSTWTPRPALVLRYDRRETSPPGCGPLGTAAHAVVARALQLWCGWFGTIGTAAAALSGDSDRVNDRAK